MPNCQLLMFFVFGVDSSNTVSSTMNTSGYRHDNSATTEQRVAQILSEAKAAMKAAEDSRVKVPS